MDYFPFVKPKGNGTDIMDNSRRARFKLNGTQNCTAARTGEKWLNEAMRNFQLLPAELYGLASFTLIPY
jgi:hypothetical protein